MSVPCACFRASSASNDKDLDCCCVVSKVVFEKCGQWGSRRKRETQANSRAKGNVEEPQEVVSSHTLVATRTSDREPDPLCMQTAKQAETPFEVDPSSIGCS